LVKRGKSKGRKKLDNVRCSARCIPSKKNDSAGTAGRRNLRLEGNL